MQQCWLEDPAHRPNVAAVLARFTDITQIQSVAYYMSVYSCHSLHSRLMLPHRTLKEVTKMYILLGRFGKLLLKLITQLVRYYA